MYIPSKNFSNSISVSEGETNGEKLSFNISTADILWQVAFNISTAELSWQLVFIDNFVLRFITRNVWDSSFSEGGNADTSNSIVNIILLKRYIII